MRNISQSFLRLYKLAEHLKNNCLKKYSDICFIKITDTGYYVEWMDKHYTTLP